MAILNTVRKVEVTDDYPTATLVTECHPEFETNGWAALLTLAGGNGTFTTSRFLEPDSQQLDRQGRGTKTYRDLPPGIYDCESVEKPYTIHRVYFEVHVGGSIEVIPLHEAKERLLDDLRE